MGKFMKHFIHKFSYHINLVWDSISYGYVFISVAHYSKEISWLYWTIAVRHKNYRNHDIYSVVYDVYFNERTLMSLLVMPNNFMESGVDNMLGVTLCSKLIHNRLFNP